MSGLHEVFSDFVRQVSGQAYEILCGFTEAQKIVFDSGVSFSETIKYNWKYDQAMAFVTGQVTALQAVGCSWHIYQIEMLKLGATAKQVMSEDNISRDQVGAFATGQVTFEQAVAYRWEPSQVELLELGVMAEQVTGRSWSLDQEDCLYGFNKGSDICLAPEIIDECAAIGEVWSADAICLQQGLF